MTGLQSPAAGKVVVLGRLNIDLIVQVERLPVQALGAAGSMPARSAARRVLAEDGQGKA